MSKCKVVDENGNVVYSYEDEFMEEKAKEQYARSCENASKIIDKPDELEKILKKLEKKLENFPVVGDVFAYLPRMALMIQSYIKREYHDIPLGTIIGVVAAIIYFVSPIDLIPDILPGLGYLDDAGVIAACLRSCKGDIDDYMEWRLETGKDV